MCTARYKDVILFETRVHLLLAVLALWDILTDIFLKEIKGINEKWKTKDLPNYAQHTVPIFFLSQEWLWCESCCGNATKYEEKTIYLCKNPITKEPKLLVNVLSFCFLSMATCFLSQLMILQSSLSLSAFFQWPDLDFEARRFTA